MSTSSLAQASLNERKKTITCTRTLFTKLSTTTTTTSTSSISSVMNDVMMTPNLQQTINPFEETNKFRLEQSVLSPNLFQIASTSTPERENSSSMWNIEQRAVLYPADIPTDESSLIAQYVYDTRMAKQVNAAVEAFWSQNKVIIESPLANSNATQTFGSNQMKNRLGTLSSSGGSSANRNNFSSPLNLDVKSNAKKSQRYATSSVSSLSSLARNNSATKLYETNKLNKKDQNCQTVLSFPIDFDLNQIPGLKEFLINSPMDGEQAKSPKLNNSIRKKLFDLDELSTSSAKNTADDSFMSPRLRQLHKNFSKSVSEPKTEVTKPAVDVSFNDDWEDSFEFDNQPIKPSDKNHRSSSPKKNKNRKIMCDMGSENEQDDSVFIADHKHAIDLSPVGGQKTPKKMGDLSSDKMDLSILSNSLFSKNLQHQHHSRFFHFDDQSDMDKNEALKSPNLSPISQKKSDLNSSTESQKSQQQKSIIFMDYSKSSEKPRQNANKSFSLENACKPTHNHHHKREEIYNEIYHDTYENLIRKTEMQSRDVNRTVLLQNSTTTTINQSSSQDTGYQTNYLGQSGTNNSSNVTNASEMMLFKKPSSLNLPFTNKTNKNSDTDKQELTSSTPLSPEPSKHNFDKLSKNLSKSCDKNECKQSFRKKFSLSLNSFETMQPIECSTPEKLKNELVKTDMVKSKTSNGLRSADGCDENCENVFKVYDCSSRNNLDCSQESEDNYGLMVKKKILKASNSLCDVKKVTMDCSFMEQSMLLKGKSASEYARTILDRAKQELMATSFYYNWKNTNRTNRV